MKTSILGKKMWQYNGASNERFVFLHVPKTGGTTFRHMLYNHFADDRIYPTKTDLKNNNGSYHSQHVLKEKDPQAFKKQMMVGHFNIQILEQLPKDVKVLCFFRNPISRVLSHIKHLKKNNPEFKDVDINDVVKSQIDKIYHVQASSMGFNPRKPNFTSLEKCVKRLDFVGMTDYFDESIALCNKMFDWNMEYITPLNTIDVNILKDLNSKSLSMISRRLIPDTKAYNYAFKHFMNMCNKHDIVIQN